MTLSCHFYICILKHKFAFLNWNVKYRKHIVDFIFAFLKTNRKVPNDYQEIEFAFTKANLSFINECTFVFLKCKFVFLIFVFWNLTVFGTNLYFKYCYLRFLKSEFAFWNTRLQISRRDFTPKTVRFQNTNCKSILQICVLQNKYNM